MGKRICFVSLDSYPLLVKWNEGHVGGNEVDQVQLGRELVKHGFDVCFVTFDEGKDDVKFIDGIKVIKAYPRGKVSRFNLFSVFPKLWRIWGAMRRAKGDLYFYEGGVAGIVGLFCRLNRKKFVYCIGSDADVDKRNPLKHPFRTKVGTKLDIKLANMLIAQNDFQMKMLRQNFGRESILIKQTYHFPELRLGKSKPPIVLWVGRIVEVKRPELLLRLAKAIPEGRFQMIGGKSNDRKFYERIRGAADDVPNLQFLGFVPFHEIGEYFAKASIFVNTSEVEGFPFTFVQAWAHYVPIASLDVDPCEIICQKKLGFHSKGFDQLVQDVKMLIENDELREQMGQNARKEVEEEHDIKKAIDKFLSIFQQLGVLD